MTDAIVLSGGTIEPARFAGLDPAIRRKAQIPILGRPMVDWTVRGLRACPEVGRIVVVGDPTLCTAELRESGAELIVESASISENLRAGLDSIPGAERGIAVSGDLPLLTGAALEDLIRNAPQADVVFPYVERADIERAFPAREWLFAKTPEGEFTGCSAFLFRRQALLDRWSWVEEPLGARRRSVLGLAMLLGPAIAARYLFGRLRVADVERKISSILRLAGRGYRTSFPELAMDVDKIADVELVERVLGERGARRRE
jgi:GTP:adenosylcobinamide-phosphate guanylyltransferase